MEREMIRRFVFATLALVASCTGVATLTSGCQTLRAAEKQTTYLLIPPQQEAELGRTYSTQIEQEYPILDDPEAQAWVQELGEKLVATSPESAQTFTFQVTTSEQINAFAIPGGYCYVNLGLICAADNVSEVAAVVGHEVNHVTTRHGVRSIQRSIAIEQLTALIAGDEKGLLIQAIQGAGGLLAMRKFGREDELEADRLGVEAMYAAGYDPRGAVRFFEKLLRLEQEQGGAGGALERIMSTHPPTQERIDRIREQIEGFDMKGPLIEDSERFQRMRQRLCGR